MNNLKTTKFAINFCLLILISACSSLSEKDSSYNQQQQIESNSEFAKLNNFEKSEVYESIITAELAEKEQNYPTALSHYLYAAQLSKNARLIEKTIQIAKLTQDPIALGQASQLWLAISENRSSEEKQEVQGLLLEAQLGQTELKLDRFNAALDNALSLLKSAKGHQQQFALLKTYVLNKEPRLTLSLLQQLDRQIRLNPAIMTAQAEMFYNYATQQKQTNRILSESLNRLEQVLSIYPLFIPAIDLKVKMLYQSRKNKEAIQYLRELIGNNPNSSELNQLLGQLFFDLQQYRDSSIHFENWLIQHPEDLQSKYFLAASHYALKEYQLSLSYFEELIEQNYQLNTVAYYCGNSAQELKQYEKAFQCFSKVTQGPLLASARIQLAKILTNNKQASPSSNTELSLNLEYALNILRKTSDLNLNDQTKLLIAEIDLLRTFYSQKAAKQRLTQAVEEQPDNITLLLKKIDLYQLIGKPKELYKLLINARNLIKTNERLYRFNLAAAQLLKDYNYGQLAIDWLNDALKLKPDDKELLYNKALIKESLGRYDETIEELKHLHKLYPDDINIKNALGYTLADLNKELDYAQALIESAYHSQPDNPAIIDSKGWIAYRLGKLDAAQEYLSRAFKMQPSPEGAAHLGEILWKKSLFEEAKNIWRTGLEINKNDELLLKTLKRFKVEL